MLLVDSLYINNGGGKVLLDYLVEQIESEGLEAFYIFDQRCGDDYPIVPKHRKIFLEATLTQRFHFYRKNKARFSKFFCFGNLPPPVFIDKAKVFIYFHNASLVVQPINYSLKEALLKRLKFHFIALFNRPQYKYLVQTEFVGKLVSQRLQKNKVAVLPFFKSLRVDKVDSNDKIDDCFVYISNGNTHKNHFLLLDAWELLANNNVFPELHLTIDDSFHEHCDRISYLQGKGVRIVNHGFINPVMLYRKAKYSIYPSLIESFGLGLMEAIDFNCEIVASDLEYVYEICEPLMVFNPLDARDIALKVEMVLSSSNKEFVSRLVVSNEISLLLDTLNIENP